MPGATIGDPAGKPIVTPSPTLSAAVVGGDPTLRPERARVRASLAEFQKYKPSVFEGETTNSWALEKWVDTIEKLFEDLMMEEDERVPLAVHFLEETARICWKIVRPTPSSGTVLPTWSTFREMLFGAFFSDSVKEKLEDDLKNIKQGNRSVMEYQREFMRLANCVPFVIRDESHKARLFVDGLRGDIFRLVQSADLHTFQQVVDRATLVERGVVLARARSERSDRNKDKKRSQAQSGGGRPPKYPRTQQGAKSPSTTGQRTGERR